MLARKFALSQSGDARRSAVTILATREKAALIAKTALATGGTIADTAQALGIMSRADMEALLVPETLTQPVRLGPVDAMGGHA